MIGTRFQSEHHQELGRTLARKRKALKLTQATAAHLSGLSLSMLRRAESHGTIPLQQLLRLADTIGYELQLQEKPPLATKSQPPAPDLNRQHPGLVWSNSKAPKEVYIRKALLNPRFGQLLKLARDFGLAAIKREWMILTAQSPSESQRVACEVNRILRNMERGAAQAG